ncbi:GntP family permease [Exilibacterium tricleocarpae]|uniref:GntP family permease n=1 Tax=Exilibacterium tricleocarpae TaxID=2591008 RepID=A0A545TZF0_9GAMM|nr:SLC13 family permease [Exilibacterium tricleocarpae]TQV82577.1 GntP family permease [Exilibacterium tricleocarpae]
MLSMIGLIGALALLIVLTIRGTNLLIAAPATALIVAVTGYLPVLTATGDSYVTSYMQGFSGFVAAWFFMFLLGSIFGKLMEDSGAADSVSQWIIGKLGSQNAVLAVVAACALLTYGGVSVFVVAFSAYPLAVSLFKQANLPRRFIPGTMAFGSVTFTMTSAGSPEIQNWIPIKYLGTSPYAAWEVSLVVALAMAGFGFWWLSRMIARARANGEVFVERADDPVPDGRHRPHPLAACLPLLTVLGVTFIAHEKLGQAALIAALAAGCLVAWALNWRFFRDLSGALSQGAMGALIAIGNTAAVVGFGSVAKASPAFDMAVSMMTSLPGNELIGAAVAVTAIAALTGSASGGQSIALPVLAPYYLDLGVNPEALHRVVAIASGALDSLPHNGYVVTTVRAICGETHKAAYGPIAALTVVIPLFGTALAIGLLLLF